jgi:hypothetical protein
MAMAGIFVRVEIGLWKVRKNFAKVQSWGGWGMMIHDYLCTISTPSMAVATTGTGKRAVKSENMEHGAIAKF